METDLSKRYEQFSRLLVKFRSDAGLSQEEVARRLGKRQSYVSKCERGARRMDVVEFVEMAKACGYDPTEFMRKFR
jgi:transcriptional regulator with XRE-family HTH domain